MRRGFIKSIVLFISLTVLMMGFSVCVSADEKITVNGTDVSKGDVITYEYYMSGIADPVEAVGSFIEYDSAALEYVDGSIGFDVLNDAMYNISDGVVYFSAINVIDGFDIKDEKLIITISFKVTEKASGNLTVKNTVDEMFTIKNEDVDLTPDDYKSRDNISVNSYTENTAPYLGMDANEIDDYLNSRSSSDPDETISAILEGNKNENASQSEKENVSSVPESNESQNETVSTATTESSQIESAVSFAENNDDNDEPTSKLPVVIAVIAVVILGACAAVVIISKKKKS